LGTRGRKGDLVTASRFGRRDQRGRRGAEGARDLSVNQHVRDAMVPEPGALDVTATAQEAGERLSDPAVRAVLVVDDDKLVGVITRKTLVSRVVAPGLDPRNTKLKEIAEPPLFTPEASIDLGERF